MTILDKEYTHKVVDAGTHLWHENIAVKLHEFSQMAY